MQSARQPDSQLDRQVDRPLTQHRIPHRSKPSSTRSAHLFPSSASHFQPKTSCSSPKFAIIIRISPPPLHPADRLVLRRPRRTFRRFFRPSAVQPPVPSFARADAPRLLHRNLVACCMLHRRCRDCPCARDARLNCMTTWTS